jgi:hypothetical protein
MWPRPAQVSYHLAGGSGLLQGVCQHGQAVRVEFAAREPPFIVCSSCQGDDGGSLEGRVEREGAKWVAKDVTKKGDLAILFCPLH